LGLWSNGEVDAALLVPCDNEHPDIEGCDYSPVEVSAVVASHAPAEAAAQNRLTSEDITRLRALLMKRNRGFMPRTLGSGG
jgi:hypothetical protein